MSERVFWSRFPVESAALTPVAGPADVARRATATDAAPTIVFVIGLLAVAARLIFINQPYIDHWSWRQNDVAAIARNFTAIATDGINFRWSRSPPTHFVFTRNTFWWLQSYPEFAGYLTNNATLIEEAPEFRIYKLTPSHAFIIPSEVENGAAGEAATWTERPEAERTGRERIKSRGVTVR